MNTRSHATTLFTAIALIIGAAQAIAKPQDQQKHFIEAKFKDTSKRAVPTYARSGWPLTIELKLREGDDGFLGFTGRRVGDKGILFPGQRSFSQVIFTDPDNCPSYDPFPPEPNDCPPRPNQPPFPEPFVDELNLGFSPSTVQPHSGFEIVEFMLEEEEGPTLAQLGPTSLGPNLGSTTDDYSLGASTRIPGLVLVSDTGVGIVTDDDFNRGAVLQCRNLAGLINSVTYVLNDGEDFSRIEAHLNVPTDLFSPIVLIDRDTGVPCGEGENLYRIEGQATPSCQTDASIDAYYDEKLVTVRAFVVSLDDVGSSEPPEIITDWNGNGICDEEDMTLGATPYRILSGGTSHSFRQFHQNAVWDAGFPYEYDLDGFGGPPSVSIRLALLVPNVGGGLVRAPR